MKQDILRNRTKRFLNELQIPISRFAKTIGFARESYYAWINGNFDFGAEKAKRIDEYLRRYGF